MNWKQWLIGATNAAISGTATAILGGVAGLTWKQMLLVSGGGAVVSFFKWVLQHPLPGAPTT